MKRMLFLLGLLCLCAYPAAAQSPVIIAQPQSITVNDASAAAFTVVATNAVSYQWFFEATNALTGETNATLSMDDVRTNQAGFYSVVATAAGGASVTSSPAQLTIVPGTIIQWTISKYSDGSSSNFTVELFDHDKPATAANFIHYITSGAYSNTYFSYDLNSYLEGGLYVAPDRTSNGLNFTQVTTVGSSFPSQLDSEFGVGPLIHNRFGTLSIPLATGETNAATTAFFFNLADHSDTSDSLEYTVFGRILSGTNVLEYFTNLTSSTNGLYDGVVPINFEGTNTPTYANLFYCDFAFQTPAPVDTNPPTVAISFPAPNAALSNSGPTVLLGTATAQANIGLAEVFGVLTPLSGGNKGTTKTNAAVGTFSWSLNLTNFFGDIDPGIYQFTAYAQDGMGVLSTPVTEYFTYQVTNLPAGLGISQPGAGATVQPTNTSVNFSGVLPSPTTVTQLTVQIFSGTRAVTTALPAVISGANWSVTVSLPASGSYTAVVVAEDAAGRQGFATENFSAVLPFSILSQPQSATVNAGASANFTVSAIAAVSYQWQLAGGSPISGATNATLTLDDVGTNQSGSSYQVVLTGANGATLTSSPALLTVEQGTIIEWTISKYADGSSNTFLVELFNHDKPATVENFIHYITSGTYSNMFFHRLVPGFVLQGGSYVTEDRTSNGLHINAISPGSSFPQQVDNEFGTGSIIHNEFGTLAMALKSGETNSATGSFFFNLADNSAQLDPQDFTVFGRILTGSNVLQYFSTLSAPTNGIYTGYTDSTNIPVDFDGTNAATDANLFYSDFVFETKPTVDTTAPTVAITYPGSKAAIVNVNPVIIQGTAQDNVGVAFVYCVFTSLTGDWAYGNVSLNLPAVGTTNWSINLNTYFGAIPQGVYRVIAYAQDGAGNLSKPTTQYFTNMSTLTMITNAAGVLSTNTRVVVPGNYTFKATPPAGQIFYSWNDNGNITSVSTLTIQVISNQTLTVTYVSNNTTLTGLTITNPKANAMLTNGTLIVTGKLPTSSVVTQMTCQLFYESTALTALPQVVTIPSGATTWSFPVTNLPPGAYTILAEAEDNHGRNRLVSETFNILCKISATVSPAGYGNVTAGLNGSYRQVGLTYPINATPKNVGQLFSSWSGPVANGSDASTRFTVTSNTVLVANFITNLFPAVMGTYNGLFFNPTNVTPSSAGYMTLNVTQLGVFYGTLELPGISVSIYATPFSESGSVLLSAGWLNHSILSLAAQIDLTNGTDTITGTMSVVSSSNTLEWSSPLVMRRVVTKLSGSNAPPIGNYTFLLNPETVSDSPAATGYAAASLTAAGKLALGGTLSDNTAFSSGTTIMSNGIWPVYCVPAAYKSKGIVIGWQTNSPSGASKGQLFWYSPTLGATTLNSTGAIFVPPAAGTDYEMILAGGGTNTVPVNSTRKFVAEAPITSWSFLSTGVFSGVVETNKQKLTFKGAFVNPTEGGGGFIVEPKAPNEGLQLLLQQ